MADAMETLEIEVKHKASGATNEIDKLADALLRLNRILAGTTIPKLHSLADALKRVTDAQTKMEKATDKKPGNGKGAAYQFSEDQKEAIRNMQKHDVAWLKLAKKRDDLEEAFNKGDAYGAIKARDSVIKAQERFQKDAFDDKYIKKFSDSEKEGIRNLKEYEVAWLKLAEAKDKLEYALNNGDSRGAVKAREAVLKAQEKYNKAYWDYFGEQEEAGESADVFERISNSLSGVREKLRVVTGGMEGVSKSAQKATKHTNKLIASFGRVMFYRAIRTVISEISKGFSEGLQNVYQYSSMIGSVISQTMDSFSSLGLQMKNQLGSALGELLVTIRPIVEYIIQLITKAADILSQFFAILGGRSTYHKALASSSKWAESTERGAEAAKEWKNQLMGFDEINRLEAPADTTGGAGAGNANNIGNFELSPTTMQFPWLEEIREFIASLNFEPLMEAIGRLKEAVIPFLETVGQWIQWIWENMLEPFITWIVEEAAPVVLDVLSSVIEVVTAVMDVIGPVLQDIWENVLEPLFSWIGDTVLSVLKDLADLLHDFAQLISGEITWEEFIGGLSDSQVLLGSVLAAVILVYGAIGVFNTIIGIATTVTSVFGGVLSFLAANPIVLVIAAIAGIIFIVVELIKHWDDMKEKLAEWEESLSEHLGNGKLEWQDFAYYVVVGIEKAMEFIEKLFGKIKSLIAKLKEAYQAFKNLLNANQYEQYEYDYSADYDYGFNNNYASGGFPDEGQMFIAREAGPEMVGTIGGRTAVANNSDIVSAIEGGVYNAMASALSVSGNRSGGGVILNVNGREFMRAIWNDMNAVKTEHGISLVTNG